MTELLPPEPLEMSPLDKRGALPREAEQKIHLGHVVFMQHAKQAYACGCGEFGGGEERRLTVWDDWTEHSAALVPNEEEDNQVHSVLVRAQLHAVGSPWMTARGAAGAAAAAAAVADDDDADFVAAGSASDRPLASLHGSFHRSTPLRHTAN